MRSYDWRMPEERYRIISDHLADVIYAYLDEYKQQGVAEGLDPKNIVVTGNPIVDVLERYYFQRKEHYAALADERFFSSRRIAKNDYYLMTCHRRENVTDIRSLSNILNLAKASGKTVYFPASYRTQKVIKSNSTRIPSNVSMVDPVDYEQFLILMSNSKGVMSDSGTVVEEACILHVPSIQMRKSTERPQVYDVGACVKFDPTSPQKYPAERIFAKLEELHTKDWLNPFGDGRASERITADILQRLENNDFNEHRPLEYGFNSKRSYSEDNLDRLLTTPISEDGEPT